MYENVFTILVVGMSIDYSVHLAHFYNHASGTRYEKAREAMYGVGVSVLGGAITTIGAGIPLFLCVVMFFYTQGERTSRHHHHQQHTSLPLTPPLFPPLPLSTPLPLTPPLPSPPPLPIQASSSS